MRTTVLLATNDENQGAVVRRVLSREGLDCPATNVVRVAQAPNFLDRSSADLIVVGLPEDQESALEVLDWLEKLPRTNGERVLAIGPAADSKMVLRALRGAVHDYLDEADLETELMAALGRWRATLARQALAGRVIAVLAPSGGSGSSTLAVNLAAVLAKQHETAALLDLKLETGDLAALLDLKPTYTLADLCHNIARMDRAFFERSLTRHASGVYLLAHPGITMTLFRSPPRGCIRRSHSPSRRSRTSWSTSTIRFAPSKSRYFARPTSSSWCSGSTSPRCAMPAAPSSISSGWAVANDRIRLVVNRYGQPKEIACSKAEEALGLKIFHYVPDDPKSVNRANNNGVPVVLESPRAAVSRSVAKLATEVNGRPHQNNH